MEVCVPDEPSPDCADKMCTLRIRYPDGSQVQRRFLAKHQLQVSSLHVHINENVVLVKYHNVRFFN